MNDEKEGVVPDVFDSVMAEYPASSTNSAREIILEKIRRFRESPSDKKAAELESLGFSVDHSDYFDHIDEIERH